MSEETIKNLSESHIEMQRLRDLSNEELVKEHLAIGSDGDDELHTEEMYSRLWADWVNQKV